MIIPSISSNANYISGKYRDRTLQEAMSFRNTKKLPTDYKTRLKRMGIGMAAGTAGAFVYYKTKSVSAKKIGLNSLGLGALCGLTLDLLGMIIEMHNNKKCV